MIWLGVYLLLEIVAVVFVLHNLYGESISLNVKVVLLIVIDVGSLIAINIYGKDDGLALLFYLYVFGYCGWEFGLEINKIVVNSTLCALMVTVIQFIVSCSCNLIMAERLQLSQRAVMINMILCLVCFLLYKRSKLYRISEYLLENNLLIAGIICIDIIFLACFLFQTKQKQTLIVARGALVAGGLLILTLLAVSLGRNIMKRKRIETEYVIQNMYRESFEGLVTEIRMRQHEFDNHITTLLGMHHICETMDELKDAQEEYLADIVHNNRFNKLLSMGNSILVGFLYKKFTDMDAMGIEITYRFVIQQFECGVPMFVIIELLGNLLDNARDELERQAGNKRLYVEAIEYDNRIVVEVCNKSRLVSYKEIEAFFAKGKSSKGKNRGLGLYHVSKICNDYKIDLLCENKEIEKENYISFTLNIKKEMCQKQEMYSNPV